MRRRFRLVAAGSCALLAAALCLAYGQQIREEVRRERAEALERYGGEVVRLVVASRGIEAGEAVDRTNVAEKDWVAELAPVGAITDMSEVLGSEVRVPVAEGVPLTGLNFREDAQGVEVPADRVALSVPSDAELGVPPGPRAGDSLAAYEVRDGAVSLLVGDLRVLMVPQEAPGVLAEGTLTVAVLPEEVAPVLAASEEGTLRFVLPGSETVAQIEETPPVPTSVPAETDAENREEGDAA